MSLTLPSTIAPTASAPRRRRGPALRKTITVDGKLLVPRDVVAGEVGVNPKTAARKCRNISYVGGVAYVEHEQAVRDLVGLNPPPRPGRGPYCKPGK